MGELDGIGEVVSGAVRARAVEPDTGAVASDGHSLESACLNCATPLVGDYCHACGQRGHVHRTLGAFVHDLLHGVLHFEGKIWRTLPLLAWKPGDLTRRYIAGQRARFVSPIALFLFSVFLMFAAVSSMGIPVDVNNDDIKSGIAADATKAEQAVKTLEAQRGTSRAQGQPTADIDRQIVEARDDASLLREIAGRGVARGTMVRVSDDVPLWLAAPLRRAAANPELLLYKIQNNAYKFSWALIPISLPFMWLLFPFSRRFRLYDHIVFVTYSLAFMTLLVVVASLLYFAGLGTLAGFALMLPPFHMYRQLNAAYGLSRGGALWRTIMLVSFSMVTIGLFIASLFASGLF
ncbi:MAG: DUF3667 domain-containing protein [Sphingomonas bacterium]|nr:DUF3667 domain-containing protein [Sphingomonas bacterium]